MIYLQLFWSFLQIGLFSIGGGYAAIPLIQAQVVQAHPWLSMSEFTDLVTIAEMTPGPIAVNSATFGCILPSLFIVSLLAFIYYRYKKLSVLQSVLASLRPAVVALIASAGLSILVQVGMTGETLNYVGLILFALAFLLLRKFKWNPILVMCLCGVGNLLVGLIL